MSGRVPPSASVKLRDLFRRFTGREAEPWRQIRAPLAPPELAVLGFLDAIEYTTVRDEGNGDEIQRYRHKFKAKDRPLVCFDASKKLWIVCGNYRMTELGIVDNSDAKHAKAR